MSDNAFGLDCDYLRTKMRRMTRDLSNYTPDEAFRELLNMAMSAASQAGHDVSVNVRWAQEQPNERD